MYVVCLRHLWRVTIIPQMVYLLEVAFVAFSPVQIIMLSGDHLIHGGRSNDTVRLANATINFVTKS